MEVAATTDAFVTKSDPQGNTITRLTSAAAPQIARTASQSTFWARSGTTYGNLSVTPGAWQGKLIGARCRESTANPSSAPAVNGFVPEFSPDGSSLIYSSYFGVQNVTAAALGLDRTDHQTASGNLYAAGGTGSQRLLGTPGAFQTAPVIVPPYPGWLGSTGGGNAFLAEFDSELRPISTMLLGGESSDQAPAMAFAANGSVIAGGPTTSKSFPLRGAAQISFARSTSFSRR
jgi:hypothetical protein